MIGAIIAIGGAEDKCNDMSVLKRVLSEAPAQRVHVITTATSYPEEAEKKYKDAFALLGVQNCEVSYINSRFEASDPALAARLSQADVIFFSGGDQLRLSFNLGGTAALQAIKQAHENGAVIAGTSAGAAALPSLMLAGGLVEEAMQKGKIRASAGLGFIKDAVVDTHFTQRGRLPRLFHMAAANPALSGIGVDEDTALVLRGDEAEVVGSGSVTIVDSNNIQTDFLDKDIGEEFSVSGVTVHSLISGERYNFATRGKNTPHVDQDAPIPAPV